MLVRKALPPGTSSCLFGEYRSLTSSLGLSSPYLPLCPCLVSSRSFLSAFFYFLILFFFFLADSFCLFPSLCFFSVLSVCFSYCFFLSVSYCGSWLCYSCVCLWPSPLSLSFLVCFPPCLWSPAAILPAASASATYQHKTVTPFSLLISSNSDFSWLLYPLSKPSVGYVLTVAWSSSTWSMPVPYPHVTVVPPLHCLC